MEEGFLITIFPSVLHCFFPSSFALTLFFSPLSFFHLFLSLFPLFPLSLLSLPFFVLLFYLNMFMVRANLVAVNMVRECGECSLGKFRRLMAVNKGLICVGRHYEGVVLCVGVYELW